MSSYEGSLVLVLFNIKEHHLNQFLFVTQIWVGASGSASQSTAYLNP